MNQNKEKEPKLGKRRNPTSNFQHLTSNKGITLVALVITIIVLLILAVVAIRAIQNDSIINYAKNSVDEYERAQANEQSLLQGYIDKIQNSTGQGPVTNPYNPDDWTYAWVCNDGTWGDMLSAGETAEGDIVAKFYKTEEKITPPEFEGMTFPEGETYHLVIEGTGEMAPLMTEDYSSYGWLAQFDDFFMGNTSNPGVVSYTTEVIICDGITSIGDWAFVNCDTLTSVTIPNSVTNIGDFAFSDCSALTSVTIPNGVTSIGDAAFSGCSALTSVTIPNSVTSIGNGAFLYCDALTSVAIGNSVTSIGDGAFADCDVLTNVYIETTSSELTVGDNAFSDMSSLSTIWVRNETVANILSGKYSSGTTVSTDYNWTAPIN